ncbi:Cytochrome P450 [Lecanosticta acicola]|uniref:Cytochrome P450 n=1 Tax=Lecanosticta acicola TaxID=111012 RepID=A0AAI8Z451_9PEZI|nr:Cytochrome P450 [Lecanosticta acicola]
MTTLIQWSWVALVGLVLWVLLRWSLVPGSRSKYLPPGPTTYPLLGNITSIPRTGIHLQFTRWAKQYGPVFSLKIGHGTMVVLTSASHATELLDKRSGKYSNRPSSHIIGELVYGNDHPMFMNPDDRWRLRRKLYAEILQETKCAQEHTRLIDAETTQLLRDLCVEPDSFMAHPGRLSNSLTMSLVYGVRTPSYDSDHYVKLQEIMTKLSALGEIGATPPVDLLGFLKWIPERFWGNWRTKAEQLRKKVHGLHTPLVDRVIERRETMGERNSFLDSILDKQEKLQLSRNEIDIMCANLLEGGTDTMATTILTLFQAMAIHPEWQIEAQKQIESVVDEFTMPSFEHFDRLPLVTSIVKELLRWRPPAPGAFPHALAKADEVDHMELPKDSTVIFNIWGIHHDPERYLSAEKFDPARFVNHTQMSSAYTNSGHDKRDHFAYGAGRRICPGIHLAERALFLASARVLWAFTIKHKTNSTGRAVPISVDPETAYRDGFLNQCRPFMVDLVPRSQQRLETIMASFARAEVDVLNSYD